MDSFLSTYRKDYRWPVQPPKPDNKEVSSISSPELTKSRRLELQCKKQLPLESCSPNQTSTKLLQQQCCKHNLSQDFVKPEIQAVQFSAVPQSENAKLNQPDGFLHQLYETNPYLYSIQKCPPSDDVKKRILAERFVSTYQYDYGRTDNAAKKLGGTGEGCGCKCNSSNTSGQVVGGQQENEDVRFVKNKPPIPMLKAHLIKEKKIPPQSPVTPKQKPGISEYMDSISKTGTMIIKNKLLSVQPRH